MNRTIMNFRAQSISFLYISVFVMLFITTHLAAQPITGVWHGQISKGGIRLNKPTQLELKVVNIGDSIFGTSYYYTSLDQFERYEVRGYRNPTNGEITWWDESPRSGRSGDDLSLPGQDALAVYIADFNCPGEGIMKLEGTGKIIRGKRSNPLVVELDKTNRPVFYDEWDKVIEDFEYGLHDPNPVAVLVRQNQSIPDRPMVAAEPVRIPPPEPAVVKKKTNPTPEPGKESRIIKNEPKVIAAPAQPVTIEEKFKTRKKILTSEIPLFGDSITLNFYDHAEIDGDSISLFLNGRLLHEHILLKATPFTVVLSTKELEKENELVMVAENLGSIPPNTSLMVAYVKGERYEARLESSENESAMIRFVRSEEP